MPSNLRIIYELRAQCPEHELDKAVYFYRVPNGVISRMYKGHEDQIKKDWPKTHGCKHDVTFTRTTIQDYRWNIKTNKAEKVQDF